MPDVLLGPQEVFGGGGRIGLVLLAVDQQFTDLSVGQADLAEIFGDVRCIFLDQLAAPTTAGEEG